jgi:hypothetical protein
MIQRIARDGERAVEVRPYPLSPHESTREQCPECGKWFLPTIGGSVRMHGPQALRCDGSSTTDSRPHVVSVFDPEHGLKIFRFTGRRNAEVIANQYRRNGAEPIVYLLETT